jgi:hypothetical protein
MEKYASFVEALADLRKRGYDADFEPQSTCLYCRELDMRLFEEEFTLDEAYRFEGHASPGDDVVVYALTSPSGVKGTIVDGLGASRQKLRLEKEGKLTDQPFVFG